MRICKLMNIILKPIWKGFFLWRDENPMKLKNLKYSFKKFWSEF